MGMFVFGAGAAFGRVDKGGGLVVSHKIATLQGVDVKFDAPIKMMHGGNVYPEDAAGGNRKITGKIKMGKIRAGVLNDLFFGGTQSVGHTVAVVDEVAVPSGTGYTVLHPGAIVDMGVESAITGLSYTRVLGAPAVGQYAVDESTGNYSFASGDPGAAKFRVSYRYEDTTSGTTIDLGNPELGTLVPCELVLNQSRNVKGLVVILWKAILHSLDLSGKQEDYTVPDLAFEAFTDDAKASPGVFSFTDND